jgi:PAS domain S-box-containing protein
MRHAPPPFRKLLFLGLFGLLLATAAGPLPLAQGEAPEFADKRVLLLHSYHPRFTHTREMNHAIERYLEPTGVDLYIEYLDTKRHFSGAQMNRLAGALALRYEAVPMDAIIATDDNAVDFIFHRRDALFPEVPVIFCGANDFDPERLAGRSGITGVNEALSLEETLRTALDLHPDAREVVVVSDVTATGYHNLALLGGIAQRYRDRADFRYFVGLPRADMIHELAGVPADAVVLYLSYFRTSAGENFSIPDSMRFISDHSPAPVYALWDFTMGHGVVGGKMVSSRAQGKTAAQLALQVLSGVSPDLLPVVMESPNRYIFDHRQLRKFGISTRNLPENSQLRFVRVPPLLRYLPWVVAALGIIGLETLLIGTLLLQRARLRRTEAALRENRARYRALFEEAPDAIYLHDLDGTFLDGNREAERLLGVSRDELIGRNFEEIGLLPGDQAENARSLLERNRDGEATGPDELVLRRRDGGRIQLEIKTHVLDETSGPVVLGIVRDITEREKAQAALRRANQDLQRLATAIDQAAEVILITDPGGRIEYANPAFERITGHPVAEIAGRGPEFLEAGREDSGTMATGWAQIRAAISRGDAWSGRIMGRRRDGRTLQAEGVISPVRDPGGEIINFVAVMRDITAEIELEAQLRQAQKMEAVGQLAGGVAHDFNNLLQVISGYAEIAAADLDAGHGVRPMLTEVLRATGRAQHLVRQLLMFSRREASHPRPLDLNQVIEGMTRMIGRVLGEHIELKFRPGPDLPTVQADPHLMEQVLMNLCVNARDAMAEGGHLRLATAAVDISEAEIRPDPWLRPGRFARLSVSDTGRGISREVRDRIFEPFFSTKEVGEGTGLGLATVYGIVKQHEGFIQVRSEGGNGTCFHIHLPATASEAAETREAPPSETAPGGGGETILLAEDDQMVRKLATRILERAGYRVRTARDGDEALERFRRHRAEIDLAILDVVMPRRSGRAVYDEIHAQRPELPVLFASGYSDHILEADGVIPGPCEVLPKPFRSETLLERVHGLLRKPAASPAPPIASAHCAGSPKSNSAG